MAEVHGKYGQVDFGATEFGEATAWEMTITADVDQFSVFGGAGWKKALGGDSVASGSVSLKQDFAQAIEATLMPGDTIALKLYETTAGGAHGNDEYWSFSAVITEINPAVGAEDGAVTVSVSFVSDGVVTKPTRA